MEKQERYTVDAPEHAKFTLRLPTELLTWFRQQAKAEHRKITGEMVLALEAWRLSKKISVFESERQETIKSLRGLCKDFGDNDWPDDLHLADVIEKHLGKYLVR